jgi:hypothetical protein
LERYVLLKTSGRYNDNLKKLRISLTEEKDKEVNAIKYIRSGVNIVQNASRYIRGIKKVELKQKFVGSILPEILKSKMANVEPIKIAS